MKKKMVRFVVFVCFLLAIFMYASCGGGVFTMNKVIFVEFHDDNDNIIGKKEDLETFAISQIDNYTGSKFNAEISLIPNKYNESSENSYIYNLYFYLGSGHFESTIKRYERKFNKQMENTGIRIVDKNGKYKTHEIYPLSNYEAGKYGKHIIVKLEKK
jgi:hypothetical protein